jgi:type II secretion system protein J
VRTLLPQPVSDTGSARQGRHDLPDATPLAGFTLIEILVATAAVAILLVALYGVFSQGTRLRDESTRRVQESHLRSRAAELLRDDLRHAMVTGSRLAATLTASTRAPASRFPGYLRFTTATGPTATNAFYGDLQEVAYFIADDPLSTNHNAGVLIRTLDRNLLAPVRQVTHEERLLHGVTAIEIEFYDGANWVTSWDYIDVDSPLPVAVGVRIRQVASHPSYSEPPPIEILQPWTIQPTPAAGDLGGTGPASSEGSGGGGGGGGGPPPSPPPPAGGAPRS